MLDRSQIQLGKNRPTLGQFGDSHVLSALHVDNRGLPSGRDLLCGQGAPTPASTERAVLPGWRAHILRSRRQAISGQVRHAPLPGVAPGILITPAICMWPSLFRHRWLSFGDQLENSAARRFYHSPLI